MLQNGAIPLILFVNGGDGTLAAEALQSGAHVPCTLAVAHGLEEAEHAIVGGLQPHVIFLRLRASGDGSASQQLERLRSHRLTEHIPIVVFAEADDPRLIAQVYDYPMTCYVLRPPSREKYVSALHKAFEFWCNTAVLPGGRGDWDPDAERAGSSPPGP